MNHKRIKTFNYFLGHSSILSNLFNRRYIQKTILMYHGISKKEQFNCVTEELFKEQISYLSEKYDVVPLNVMVKNISDGDSSKAGLVSITFDDGYANFGELGVPILKEYGCHATLFVPAGKVGHFNDWDKFNNAFCKMSIMSFEQLRQLPESIVEIGSHGISHVALDGLTFDELREEIVESRLRIEDGIGRPVRFFAYPFGIYPYNHCSNYYYGKERKLLAHYMAACTIWWGRYNSLKNIYTLRRIGIWDSDSFGDFVDKLEGNYDWLVMKEKIGRFCKSIRAMAMG